MSVGNALQYDAQFGFASCSDDLIMGHAAISHFGEVLRVVIALGTRQVGAIKQTKTCFLNDAVYGCV